MRAQPFSKHKEKKANKSNENAEFSKIEVAVPDGMAMNQIQWRPSFPLERQSVIQPLQYNSHVADI